MFSVIMAGGSGTRFWPASRERLPKQFLKITSERTMFEETLARVLSFCGEDEIYAVVGNAHRELVLREPSDSGISRLTSEQVLIEPAGRNTAACIGLAAIHLARLDQDQPIVVLPADHFVGNVNGFAQTINEAANLAKSGGIVTVGINPTRPETGYGYIRVLTDETAPESIISKSQFRMERFVEKPDYQTAVTYLADGRHFWNSGIFIFTARTILNEINDHLPELAAGLEEIAAVIGKTDYEEVLAEVYAGLDPISIDYGVMERTRTPVEVLKGDFGWSDVGSWQALYELRSAEYDSSENLLLSDALAIDSRKNLVYSSSHRLVSLLGVNNLMVIDTPDVVMIAPLDQSQRVKEFPSLLKEQGRLET